jgi:DNA-binding IscR family transcriptional regulator
MKQERKRDFFCYNTENSTNWTSDGVSSHEALALIALLSKVTLGGMVYASQAELAAVVKCNRATLNKGLQSLIEKELVCAIPGKRAQYQINRTIGTKLA